MDYRGYEVTVENFLRVLTGPRTACLLFPCLLLHEAESRTVEVAVGPWLSFCFQPGCALDISRGSKHASGK